MVLPFIKSSIAVRLLFLTLVFTNFHNEAENVSVTPPTGFAVVELFTSEGCSSCPPADKVVTDLANKYGEQVYVLGFHVDYWNRLGWKDEFSSVAYSKRQGAYATVFSLDGVYTPQVVVNGEKQFVGSDRNKLEQTVQSLLKEKPLASIELNANTGEKNTVKVSYTAHVSDNSIINLTLIQLKAESSVARGENKGLNLHHINVVRDFKTVNVQKDRSLTSVLTIPEGLAAKDCKVIAYTQEKGNLHITGVTVAVIK